MHYYHDFFVLWSTVCILDVASTCSNGTCSCCLCLLQLQCLYMQALETSLQRYTVKEDESDVVHVMSLPTAVLNATVRT